MKNHAHENTADASGSTLVDLSFNPSERGFTVFDRNFRLIGWNSNISEILKLPYDRVRRGIHISGLLCSKGKPCNCSVDAIQFGAARGEGEEPLLCSVMSDPNVASVSARGIRLSDGAWATVYSRTSCQQKQQQLARERRHQQLDEFPEITQDPTIIDMRRQSSTAAYPEAVQTNELEERRSGSSALTVPALNAYVDRDVIDNYCVWCASDNIADSVDDSHIGACGLSTIQKHLEYASSGRSTTFEYEARPATGHSKHIRTTIIPDIWQDKVIGFFIHSLEATKDRQPSVQQTLANDQEAVARVSRGLAHDFNNVLTVILGKVASLKGPGIDCHVDQIRDAARIGSKIAKNLASIVGNQPWETSVVDVRDLVKSVFTLFRSSMGEEITVTLHNVSDICLTEVDATQFENTLLNLLLNARDAVNHPGGVIDISVVKDAPRTGQVQINVSDNGKGIDKNKLDKIFEPFHTTKDKKCNSGLGLSCVASFAERSGGEVHVDSEIGMGATFSLTLPLIKQESDRATSALEEPGAKLDNRELVLVVDGHPRARELYRSHLMALGYGVMEAPDGIEAIRLLERDIEFSHLISDVSLPGKYSGLELVRFIKERKLSISAGLTTSYSENHPLKKTALSLCPTLTKPFDGTQFAMFMSALRNVATKDVKETVEI